MKEHTLSYKNNIKEMGRELDVKITYGNIILDNETINSVKYSCQGALLKSVMKELEIDSNVVITKGTEINFKFGISLDDSPVEYLNFGNYIVKNVEKQEDSNSYLIKCYDKLLYSMDDYKSLDIQYPCKIREYINALCTKLNLNFKNKADTFVNYDKTIPTELYLDSKGKDIGFTYRDVFDQLAEVTASTICLDLNDNVEIRYINDTDDTIDEEYLKDKNVNFGEKFGPINSVVLSRSGADNIYRKDDLSVQNNGLCEIKIIDNQIMNFNNRDEYIDSIYNKLKGIEYYLNDFSSTGITYYDLLDRYNVKIENKEYSCLMLNDEINIEQGLEENISTEKQNDSTTDYTKADKTDRKINQTYFLVDKQNGKIESVVTQVGEQNKKISKVEQSVSELSSQIKDIADITEIKESITGILEFNKVNESEPININIRPIGKSISYLYPSSNLFPSADLFSTIRTLRFTNLTDGAIVDYELPNDLLYLDGTTYDEFILDYDLHICKIIQRCDYNADGTVYKLPSEKILNYDYPLIQLTAGDYKIEVLTYDTAYLQVRVMSQNIYTTQFSTKTETESKINQKANEINLSVNQKLTNYSTTTEMNSAIEINNSNITSTVSKTYATKTALNNTNNNLTQTNEDLSKTNEDLATAKTEIKQNAEKIKLKVSKGNVKSEINLSPEKTKIKAENIEFEGTVTANGNFKILTDGSIEATNGKFSGDIEMTGGGSILSKKGLLSNLHFIGQNASQSNGIGGYYYVGLANVFDYFERTTLNFDIYIPDNFTIEKAILQINSIPILLENGWHGSVKNLHLFKGTMSKNTIVEVANSGEFFAGINNLNLYDTQLIDFWGDANTAKETIIDITKILQNGTSSYILKTTMNLPTFSQDYDTNQNNALLNSSFINGNIFVIGYLNKNK